VTVAGTIGSWWFASKGGVRGSFFRASFFSFGSICLGSLLVAIVSSLKDFFQTLKNHKDSVFLCCAQCCLNCIEFLVDYFNKWAFVYVALKGDTFLEAGKNVTRLFKQKGWETIITDSLVDTILLMVSICVGLITGCFTGILAIQKNMQFGEIAPWVVGFVVGFIFTSTIMSLVASSVNTIIVCFAENPDHLEKNHPHLYPDMIHSWRHAWPDDFHY